MLRELAPQTTRFAALVDPAYAFTDGLVKDAQGSAAALGLPIEILRASTVGEIDAAFVTLAQASNTALLVSPNAFFTARRAQLATLAVRHAIPAIYPIREFAEAGGLISSGPNFLDVYRQTGHYVARILKGEKPGDLPIMQPTKFELTINLTTARAIGITIPNTLLALADVVIE
jgi:putative tryptophan/tyrosine transport system substrate-binding protein